MPRPSFCLPINKDGNKPGRAGLWDGCCRGAGRAELCPRRGGTRQPESNAFMLATPSEPAASLLRNSLKEIIRFMHSNVLANREKHPTQFQPSVREKASPEHRAAPDGKPAPPAGSGLTSAQKMHYGRKGVASGFRPLQFSAAAQ